MVCKSYCCWCPKRVRDEVMVVVCTHPSKDECCCPKPFIFFVHRWWCLVVVLISVILFSLLLFSLLGNQHVPGREDIGGVALVTAPTSRPDRNGVMTRPIKRLPTNAALPLVSLIVHLHQGLWSGPSSSQQLQWTSVLLAHKWFPWPGNQPGRRGWTGSICPCQSVGS